MGTTGILYYLTLPFITIQYLIITLQYPIIYLNYLQYLTMPLPYNTPYMYPTYITLHTTDITHTQHTHTHTHARVHGGSVHVDKMSVFFDCETQTLGTSHDITVMPLNYCTYYACQSSVSYIIMYI